MMKQVIKCAFLLLSICALGACQGEKTKNVLSLFPTAQPLSQSSDFFINDDSLAQVEGIICSGENLVVSDRQSGSNYILFDASGEYINRFGNIGSGPTEIPMYCSGSLSKRSFVVFNNETGIIMKCNLLTT